MEFPQEIFKSKSTFRDQKAAIPPDMRPLWRVSALALVLAECRGRKASIRKLQILNWAIRTTKGMDIFVSFLKDELPPEKVIIRYDPGFLFALDLLQGLQLVVIDNGKSVKLSEKGISFTKKIIEDDQCMKVEKEFLGIVKPLFTEGHINSLLAEI